ncbi:MAG: dipeptidase PepV [Clostridia bacterium]
MNFDSYIDKIRDKIISSTQEIIRIPSIEKEAMPGKPFGKDVHEALEYMLELGRSMGFKTKNIDGYIGYIEFGEGDELVGILAHLDVVPEGTGWTYPPYAAEIHDNRIYGRGAIDDKGPAVAALYAMKAVKDSGIKLGKRIRLILGLDEESGWGCIQRYKQTEEIPHYAFTPDGDYPVIHAEKGIVNYKLSMSFHDSDPAFRIIKIKGGHRPNMVPDFCEAQIELPLSLIEDVINSLKQHIESKQLNIELSLEGKSVILKSHGKSSHGSTPDKGINAISQLMVILHECMKSVGNENPFIKFYYDCIGMETNGKSVGCSLEDKISGRLTFNIGLLDVDSNYGETVTNIRYPVTFTEEEISKKIFNALQPYKLNMEKIDDQAPLLVSKDHPLVQKLIKVYREVTGDASEPLSIGGGTYARAFENAVAFGASFPGEPELAHEKDEYISIDSLIKNAKIFARAIYELAK